MFIQVVISVPAYAAFGSCYACRTVGDTRTYVDLGIDIAGEGGLVLCSNCVDEIAREAGYVPATQFAGLTSKVKKLSAENDELRDKATRLDDMVALLNARASA